MNLILHIFRKDARHLYPEIAITLVFTVAFAWVAPVQWLDGSYGGVLFARGIASVLAPLLRVFLPVIWLVLITRLVQDESLVGDKQFWVTRPYTWPTLLAAKIMFLLVFLYLPLILMQIYLLHHAGLNVRAALPDLLLYQLRLTVIYFLPVFAIATVTATFARQFVTVLAGLAYLGLVSAAWSTLLNNRIYALDIHIVITVLAAMILLTVVLLQYARRRTLISRLVLIGLPILLAIVALGASAKMLVEREYPVAMNKYVTGVDLNPLKQQPTSGVPYTDGGEVRLNLPILLRGVPSGTGLDWKGVSMSLAAKDGFHWSLPYSALGGSTTVSNTSFWEVRLPVAVFERIMNTPVNVSISVLVQEDRNSDLQTLTAEEPGFAVPGRGLCPVGAEGLSGSCRYPLRMPPPTQFSAQVLDKPCLESNGATRSVVKTYVNGNQDYMAYDFDPVTISQLRLELPTGKPGVSTPGYLCPGSQISLVPRLLAGRERFSFSQSDVVLGPYVRRMGMKANAPGTEQVQP